VKNNTLKTVFITLITAAALAVVADAKSGPFLDLDIGSNLSDNHNHLPDGTYLKSDENPLGQIRIGYQTKAYNLFGPVDIRAHGYWQHRSSLARTDDNGFNLLMFGIRIE